MGMEAGALAAGVIGGTAGGHLQRLTTPDDEVQNAQLAWLCEMHGVLADMRDFFRQQALPERFDMPWIQMLYKQSFGSNWIPKKENNQYFRVWAPVATALNVTTPVGPAFVLTIPAITVTYPNMWLPFDFPDGSSIMLDSTAAANQMNIYIKRTDVAQE